MSTAGELLAAGETAENKVLIIDSDLRTIAIPSDFGVFGVESDADVLRVHFRGPRFYHGVDLSTFDLRINIKNASDDEDLYIVDDLVAEDDAITFSWLVGRFVAESKGTIEFALCFRELDANGTILREFNTTTATGKILEGLEVDEHLVREHSNIIENILARLKIVEETGGGNGGNGSGSGTPGAPGKSAYQYAVEAGFVGTEEEFAELLLSDSIKQYGAIGDGKTDDTAAFQNALANERTVSVPGGTYVLSDTLVIRPNCCLELSQDTVLKFTQTNKHGITMHRLANLKGNRATIFVPYTFGANVINCDGGDDYALLDNTSDTTLQNTNATAVPPFKKWDPQWKMSRYVTDINICKVTDTGSVYTSDFHYSADGTCYGKAIYVHCNEADWPANYMWGVSMSGVRIAGGFEYGIRIHNIGDPVASWNHDMRIEALIDACKIGVSIENCRYSRLAVTIQPRKATDGTVYAEHGFELIDSCGTDLSQSRVWDWNERITKWAYGNKYQHVAMIGDCHSLILDDYRYNSSSIDIRDFIYTDNARNLETMIVVQEPITRWFKTKEGVPYFYNGKEDKKLVSDEELQSHFKTDYVSNDVLRTATDTDGTIFNEIGYKNGEYLSTSGDLTTSSYYSVTGFIPITPGHTFYTKDMTLVDADGLNRLCLYDKDKNLVRFASLLTALTKPEDLPFLTCWELENGFAVTIKNTITNVAYIRFSVWKKNVSDAPMVAIDEEVQLKAAGFLADNIKVKAENVVGTPSGGTLLTSPSGKVFELTVSDAGALSVVPME